MHHGAGEYIEIEIIKGVEESPKDTLCVML